MADTENGKLEYPCFLLSTTKQLLLQKQKTKNIKTKQTNKQTYKQTNKQAKTKTKTTKQYVLHSAISKHNTIFLYKHPLRADSKYKKHNK
jgi:hypothetical protein